jgi:hypothetical protein
MMATRFQKGITLIEIIILAVGCLILGAYFNTERHQKAAEVRAAQNRNESQ